MSKDTRPKPHMVELRPQKVSVPTGERTKIDIRIVDENEALLTVQELMNSGYKLKITKEKGSFYRYAEGGSSIGTTLSADKLVGLGQEHFFWETSSEDPGEIELEAEISTEAGGPPDGKHPIIGKCRIDVIGADSTRLLANAINSITSRITEKDTADTALWEVIENATERCDFKEISKALDKVCEGIAGEQTCYSFLGDEAYKDLLIKTQNILKENCATEWDVERTRKYRAENYPKLPLLAGIAEKLKVGDEPCHGGIIQEKLSSPLMMELIWSYWLEEGGLVQTLNAISFRFQNKRHPAMRNPLSNFAVDPLRPLNNVLWGYIQREQERLSLNRRIYEYNHQYGLILYGKAVPKIQPVETRSKFLKSFHTLLSMCSVYYKEYDDTTIRADAFPLLNALKELHLILAEGAHNQFGDMTWTSRAEMMLQGWILARPEMREFLGGRAMMPYEQEWMGRVDTMKKMQGWTDVSITHFYNLAVWGEQILLSVRYGNWNNSGAGAANAANWAVYWRNQIQGYTHAYRTVTGVDLIQNSPMNYCQPSPLIHKDAA